MDKLKLPKGQIIHVGSIPFELAAETVVLGREENLNMLEVTPAETKESQDFRDGFKRRIERGEFD